MFDETRTVVRLGDGADETLARAFVERAVADGARPSGELVVIRGGMIELRSETGASVARVPLDGDAVASAHLQGHLVVPLADAFSGARIWVDAEGTIPWSTIVDVLYTAGRSGVREYGLRHGDRWLDVSPPTFHGDPAQAPARERDALRLHVKFAGNDLVGRISRGLAGDSVAVHGGDGCSLAARLDTSSEAQAEQSAASRRLCALGAGHYVLTLSPGPSVPIDEVARTLERFIDVPGCDVDVVVESGDDAPLACDPAAQALATFE